MPSLESDVVPGRALLKKSSCFSRALLVYASKYKVTKIPSNGYGATFMKAIGYSTWQGSWKEGTGTLSTGSDTLRDSAYSFSSRFEGAPGGSPEELLGTALAGCFNQALANNFGMNEVVADSISTSVTVELGTGDDGHPAIKSLHVITEAAVPGISDAVFAHCAERARTHCTLAKIFKSEITLQATLKAA
jgi:osmotically inducible protein OsmC